MTTGLKQGETYVPETGTHQGHEVTVTKRVETPGSFDEPPEPPFYYVLCECGETWSFEEGA